MYTQFRKKVENDVLVRKLILIPDKLKPIPCSIDPGEIPGFADFNLPSKFLFVPYISYFRNKMTM